MEELSSDGWLIASANESMRECLGSVAVIYPLLSCLVLIAGGRWPRETGDGEWVAAQEEEEGGGVEGARYQPDIMWRKTCLGGWWDHLFRLSHL